MKSSQFEKKRGKNSLENNDPYIHQQQKYNDQRNVSIFLKFY